MLPLVASGLVYYSYSLLLVCLEGLQHRDWRERGTLKAPFSRTDPPQRPRGWGLQAWGAVKMLPTICRLSPLTPALRLTGSRASSVVPRVLASHMCPHMYAFSQPSLGAGWAKWVLGMASEKQIKMLLFWGTAPQSPAFPGERTHWAEAGEEPVPQGLGLDSDPAQSSACVVGGEEEAGLSGEGRLRSARAGGCYLGCHIVIRFLPVRLGASEYSQGSERHGSSWSDSPGSTLNLTRR